MANTNSNTFSSLQDYLDSPVYAKGGEPAKVRKNGRSVYQPKLPNLIWKYRNGRAENVGYDDPTYFGFVFNIHSEEESEFLVNPFTGLRANPLFYTNPKAGSPDLATGKFTQLLNNSDSQQAAFSEILKEATEANALHYLNHFNDMSLDKSYEVISADGLPLRKQSNTELINGGLGRENEELNRAFYLIKFKELLNSIQTNSPWTFKEVDGISGLWGNSFGKTSTSEGSIELPLTVTCEETVDLRVSKLAYYYKMLSYDSFNRRKLLPSNLEQFSMDVYLMDLRYLKHLEDNDGEPDINPDWRSQIAFGAVAFRCFGCTFDFTSMFDGMQNTKNSIDATDVQPKFKILVKKVLPASYFGTHSFGTKALTGLTELGLRDVTRISNASALDGAFDFGPFTGGITRVLNDFQTQASNFLSKPATAINDALYEVQQRFEEGVEKRLQSNPYGSVKIEELINARKGTISGTATEGTDVFPGQASTPPPRTIASEGPYPAPEQIPNTPINSDVFDGSYSGTGGPVLTEGPYPAATPISNTPITTDVFPGTSQQTAPPITVDVFPGEDTRTGQPINRDFFPGKDDRSAAAIQQDVFPGEDIRTASPIATDVFPGSARPERGQIATDVFPGEESRKAAPISLDVFPGTDSKKSAPIQTSAFSASNSENKAATLTENTFGRVSAESLVNQRKKGDKITSTNPIK